MFLVNKSEKKQFNGYFVVVSFGEDCSIQFKVYCDMLCPTVLDKIEQCVLNPINYIPKDVKEIILEKVEGKLKLVSFSKFDYSSDQIIEKENKEQLIRAFLMFKESYELINKNIATFSHETLEKIKFNDGYPLAHSFDESTIPGWVDDIVEELKFRM